jgi:poly-gamma-glutamate capsule biosynthesis protein CapA/YwtB (metallophosphatase superfamily)
VTDALPSERELATTVADGFTIAAVGDCITSRPLAPMIDSEPEFARAVEIVRRATAAIGNLETAIVDVPSFTGSLRTSDDWCLAAGPGVAADLASLGFDMVGRANNHANDWGHEGLLETSRHLDDAGMTHAGAGPRLAHARAARYRETPLGRIALVSFATTQRFDNDAALDPEGQAPGRPGISTLRLRPRIAVPPPVFQGLRDVSTAMEPWASALFGPDEVDVFGAKFVHGRGVAVSFEPDPHDLHQIMLAIRQGKQHADALVLTAHVHEEGPDPSTPPAFLVDLVRAAIDNGADAFVGHGVHRLWPVERYRDRPILYGLGNFIWSDLYEPLHGSIRRSALPFLPAGTELDSLTDADVTALLEDRFIEDTYGRSVIAEIVFEGGGARARLHPIDLGIDRRLTERGIPRLAAEDVAKTILEDVRSMSEPLATEVVIEGGVGHF